MAHDFLLIADMHMHDDSTSTPAKNMSCPPPPFPSNASNLAIMFSPSDAQA
jgi:hypothetical protein